MNFMQQQYKNMTQQPYSNNSWSVSANNRVRPVSSIEEARAASIDFDGSVFYFPDFANKKIYTKQINLDGTATLNMYEQQPIPTATAQPVVDTSNFVTRQEFENTIKELLERAVPAQTESKEPAQAVEAPAAASTQPVFNF